GLRVGRLGGPLPGPDMEIDSAPLVCRYDRRARMNRSGSGKWSSEKRGRGKKMILRLPVLVVVAAALAAVSNASAADLVDTAVAGRFNTLAAALKAAGLVDALKGSGPFTVFAPTDEAFAKLPSGTLENLLKPENKDQL